MGIKEIIYKEFKLKWYELTWIVITILLGTLLLLNIWPRFLNDALEFKWYSYVALLIVFFVIKLILDKGK
tara:strand:- start:6 stop:215 length:210 start_codon:yes stop_codon:yes gene_type:complete